MLSAKQQRLGPDATLLFSPAGLGHAPQDLDHPKGLDWKGCAEMPLDVRTDQVEMMGSTAPQELGWLGMLFSHASVWSEIVV